MLKTVRGFRGAVTSPHHAASHAGLNVLREGGNALEAAIATAAAIAVVYPHMNGLGGDNASSPWAGRGGRRIEDQQPRIRRD